MVRAIDECQTAVGWRAEMKKFHGIERGVRRRLVVIQSVQRAIEGGGWLAMGRR